MAAVIATAAYAANTAEPEENNTTGRSNSVFYGLSGGIMLHTGYGFAQNPQALFSNWSIAQENLKGMNKGGIYLGIGGALRVHLFNHLRVGAEAHVSSMPMKKGSHIRTGWGGALADIYFDWGKVRPYFGIGLGGGQMRRTYVSHSLDEAISTGDTTNIFNASFEKSPFFYLDPQVGMEFRLSQHLMLTTRLDWMLPFGKNKEGIGESMKNWNGYMSPSGPRLYVGVMFGR